MKIKCADFNLKVTLESGQVFGFTEKDGGYEGPIDGKPARLVQRNGTLEVRGVSAARVRNYLDLDRDLSRIYAILEKEPISAALDAHRGLRLIRQNSWEALACFILSSNNNVKRIMGIHRNITDYYGGFPQAVQVAQSHERILRQLGLGYRAPFLSKTAQFLSTNPFYLETIRTADYEEARARVLAFPGIGPKVADCALLYGFNRLDAFPVDVWILRVMRKFYFRNRRVNEARVHAFGRKRWGACAGYIQQYLFHGARTGVLY